MRGGSLHNRVERDVPKREHSGRRKERESMDAKEEGAHARWEGERRIYWVEWEEEIADWKEERTHASSGVGA